jgi:phage-related tail protein
MTSFHTKLGNSQPIHKENLNLNITVNNKQVDLAKISFKQFDDIIKQAKKDLQALPLNDPRYKTLVSDINAAEKAWKQAQAGAGQFNDEMEEGGGKVLTYSQQIRIATRELISIEQQFGKNSQQYQDQAQKLKNLRDEQDDLSESTRKLDDSLAAIPGPIGQIGQAMQQLGFITNNAKSALNSLGLGFKTLDQIFKTTAIGALVAIILLLVTAIARAAKSFKPLQDAFAQIGGAVDGLFEALRPLTEFLLNVFIGAITAVSFVIAWPSDRQ